MIDIYPTTIQERYQAREEIRVLHTSVFSDTLVSNRYEIDTEEMRLIDSKVERSMNFGQNWNGPNTHPPSIESVDAIRIVLDLYNDFLQTNSINPASVQIYPLNEGGFGIELITNLNEIMFKIENETMDKGSYDQIIHYYITDDHSFEESGETKISRLIPKFLKLHSLA